MSGINAMGNSEFVLTSLQRISHPLSKIFFIPRFEIRNLGLATHGSWILTNTGLAFRRSVEWFTTLHGLYMINFFILCLFIYDALRPRPITGIPTSGHYGWALGDSGALYRHMRLHKTRTTFFTDQAARVGPISQVMLGPAGSWFGKLTGLGTHIVVLADGEQLFELCTKRSQEFPDPGSTLDIYHGIIPNGQLALPTGSTFKHHRRSIAHSVSSSHLSKITPKITKSVIELIQLWKKRSQILDASGQKYFKAAQDLRLSTMDAISDIIFGKPFEVMSARLAHLENTHGIISADARPQFPTLARALNVIVAQVARCYVAPSKPLFWLFQRLFNAEWRRAKVNVFNYLRKEVEKEREFQKYESVDSKDVDNADSVLSLLVKDERLSRTRQEKPLSTEEMIEELLVYWVAGHGTMACTLAWAVKLLSNHPEVQHRLHRQLINTLPSLNERPPTFSDLKQFSSELSYLDATCYEILRCGNVLAEISRTSRVVTTIMGYAIPKNTVVMMPHNSSLYSGEHSTGGDSRFWPERWLDAEAKFDAQRAGPLHVFGHGQRGCFGRNLAVLELRLYIAMLAMELFFDQVPEEVNSMDPMELVANHPQTCVIRPRAWSQIENKN